MGKKKDDYSFITITNKDIYNELKELKAMQLEHFEELNHKVTTTNGKVKKSLWIASTAMTLTILLLGFLFNHIGK